MNQLFRIFIIMIIGLVLSACASNGPAEKSSDFIYAISATPAINPDINARASSVVVRIYQLKNRVNFDNARYEDLFNPIKNTLGAEFIAVNEYLIDPGMEQEFEVPLSSQAKYIGVAVGYRSIDMVNWRTITTVPETSLLNPLALISDGGIKILVDELSVRTVEY